MGNQSSKFQKIGLIGGPIISLFLIIFVDLDPENPQVTYTAAIALLMAIWWICEALPLAITSLLPVFLFPLFSIMNGKDVASLYFNHIIFLLIGGFLVALAMQRWGLHKRIALVTLKFFGVKPGRILLGFMITTAFLSMWISNTASTMMMIPIVLSVIVNLENILGPEKIKKYSIGLLLGIAYSASIGGTATLVGTPPNLSFARIFSITFPDAPEITFSKWFLFAFPIALFLLLTVWVLLRLFFCRINFSLDKNIFQEQYRKLGKITFEERVVLINFIALATLWLTRSDIELGRFTIPGWSGLLPNPDFINDGTIAIAISSLLFIIPSKKKSRIMDWDTASKLPWNIVLLLGGGFALASGFKESGLSAWFGEQLAGLHDLSPFLIVISVTSIITFMTELTSNTATAEMLLPILAAVAVAIEKNPLLLMVPAALSCSCAFMLPIATPPNAIIFGTQRIRIRDMVKIGILLNLIGIIILATAIFLLGDVLDIDLDVFPNWAK